ncbi:phosphopantetheine-binding protein [Tautonia plasticadhaerens]|uniref:Putative acyl carrier protein IacP n=1 Tax=Tautonia plasticadhaerens TaxID=2527974 RepID=A0A518H729_9BACT|nr:phosphopantetheine-binding protein [Tautonia plasticadhaerens]QDV36697.1 putative acyl carrier protein IacP [Tautonia plasticadhaerens]
MSDQDLLSSVSGAIRSCSEVARDLAIDPHSRLVEDLSLDSLDLVAVMMHLQDEHAIELDLDAVPGFEVVSDLMTELARQVRPRAA